MGEFAEIAAKAIELDVGAARGHRSASSLETRFTIDGGFGEGDGVRGNNRVSRRFRSADFSKFNCDE